MFNKFFTILLVSFFASSTLACTAPSASKLKSFFGKADWSGFMGSKLKINFKNPKASTLTSPMGTARITSFCLKGNTIHVSTNKGNATVTKSGNKLVVKPSGKSGYTFVSQTMEADTKVEGENAVYRPRFSHGFYMQNGNYIAPELEQNGSGAIDI